MKKARPVRSRLVLYSTTVLAVVLLNGCVTCPCAVEASPKPDQLVQVSIIDALLKGVYDGEVTCGEVKQHGDFGLGTFQGLDGEMIVFGGDVLQVSVDGQVRAMPDETKTPFAVVTWFDADKTFSARDVDYNGFKQVVDAELPSRNWFYAIKAEGRFAYMKTRSVPGQQKPYPPLVDVVKEQAVFEMEDVEGTLIGFWSPSFVKGMNVPGYHLHFLSDDRTRGGHVLAFRMTQAAVSLDVCHDLDLRLPGTEAYSGLDLTEDMQKALHTVEKDKK